MKCRSIFASLLATLALTVSMTSCSRDDSDDSINETKTEDHRVVYLLCNGQLNASPGSLSLMYLDTSPIITMGSIYSQRNSKLVGDLSPDFIYKDGYFFMTVANSKSLVKMNFAGMEVSRYKFYLCV